MIVEFNFTFIINKKKHFCKFKKIIFILFMSYFLIKLSDRQNSKTNVTIQVKTYYIPIIFCIKINHITLNT